MNQAGGPGVGPPSAFKPPPGGPSGLASIPMAVRQPAPTLPAASAPPPPLPFVPAPMPVASVMPPTRSATPALQAFRAQVSELLRMADVDSPPGDQQTAFKILAEFITTSTRGGTATQIELATETIATEFMPTFHRFLTTPPKRPAGDGASPNAATPRHPPSLILHIVQSLALLSRPIPSSSPPAASPRVLRIIVDEFGLLPILLDLLLQTFEKRLIEALLALMTHIAKHRTPPVLGSTKSPADYIAEVALDKAMPYCLLHSHDAIKGNALALIAALLEHYLIVDTAAPAHAHAPTPPVYEEKKDDWPPHVEPAFAGPSPAAAALAVRMFKPDHPLGRAPPPTKEQRYAFMEDLLARRNLLYFLTEMREGKNIESGPIGSDVACALKNVKGAPAAAMSVAGLDLCDFNPTTCPIPLSLLLPPPSYEVSQNIARCLHLLGFTPGRDEPNYRAMVDSLQSMGFARGSVEWCIWKWQHEHTHAPRRSVSASVEGQAHVHYSHPAHPPLPDLQVVMTWLLDHTQPSEPPAAPAASPLQAHAHAHKSIGSSVGAKREPAEALAPLVGGRARPPAQPVASQPPKVLADALAPLLHKKNKKLPTPPEALSPASAAAAAAFEAFASPTAAASSVAAVSAPSASARVPSVTPMVRSSTTPAPASGLARQPLQSSASASSAATLPANPVAARASSDSSSSSDASSEDDIVSLGAAGPAVLVRHRPSPIGPEELARLYAEQSASIESLKDMGFGEKRVLLALNSHHSVEASVRWLVEQQEAREKRAEERAARHKLQAGARQPQTTPTTPASVEQPIVAADSSSARPSITISPASAGSASSSYSVPLPPLSAPSQLDPPSLVLPPSLHLPMSAPPPATPDQRAITHSTSFDASTMTPQRTPTQQQSSHANSQPKHGQLHPPSTCSPLSPPSSSSRTDDAGSDSDGPGSARLQPHSASSSSVSSAGARVNVASVIPSRLSNLSSRSTSNDHEGVEGELARTTSSRASSSHSPFHTAAHGSTAASASSHRIGMAHGDNTEAPPLLLSPQQFEVSAGLTPAPAPRARATTTPAGSSSGSNLLFGPLAAYPVQLQQVSPTVPTTSAFDPAYKRANYYDESPEPPERPERTSSGASTSGGSYGLANRSTPHSRAHSPSALSRIPTPLSRLSSGGGGGSPAEAEARRREELYWEEANSATYPSRVGRFLPPNRKPTPPQIQRPVYFNPHASPSPPPPQIGRMHSVSNPPLASYYPAHHAHAHSTHTGSHVAAPSRASSNPGKNTWSPGQIQLAQQQQIQQPALIASSSQEYKSVQPTPEFHRTDSQRWNLYGEGESVSASMQVAAPLSHARYAPHQPSHSSSHHHQLHYGPPPFHHAASVPHVMPGRQSLPSHAPHFGHSHSHSSSQPQQHTTPPHARFHHSSHSTSPSAAVSSVAEGEGQIDDARSGAVSPTVAQSSPRDDSGSGDSDMEAQHVIAWLQASNFGEYIPLFLHHEVSLEMVRGGEIDEVDLARMGIEALGVRKKMMRAIKKEQEHAAIEAAQQQKHHQAAQQAQQPHYPYYGSEGSAPPHDARHTPQHFYSLAASPPTAHTPPESTTGTPRSTSPQNTSGGTSSSSSHHHLHMPPISHHPNSDLADYHSTHHPPHYGRDRDSAGYYPRETGGPPHHPMDLIHSRSQSHDSLHASLTSPGYHHQPSQSSLGSGTHHQSLAHLPLHISFLQASPLLHSESPGRSHALNIEKETELIRDSLIESGRNFRVRFAVATKDNLLKMLTKGTRALHISGHGDPHHLILENALGGVEALDQTVLRNLLIVGGSDLQFVFISSCFSYRAAVAFLAAGVKHVIAVQEDTQVSDTSARAFAAHVYLALCQGRSVREAFHKGQAAVLASNSKNKNEACCCAHLHSQHCSVCEKCRSPVCCAVHTAPCHSSSPCCSPTIPHGESLKFLLLPKEDGSSGVNHDVRLFDDVPEGRWLDLTPPKPPNNLPSIPDHFTGRSQDVFAVIQIALTSRLTTITGHGHGIGKSALARAVGTYINDRRHFEHGVFLVRCGKIGKRSDRHRERHFEHAVAPGGMSASASPSPPAISPLHVAHELNLLISKAMNLDFYAMHGGGGPASTNGAGPGHHAHSHHTSHGHSHGHAHAHHSHNNNQLLDPETLQEHLIAHLKDKHLLLILDDLDELIMDVAHRPETKAYIKMMLDSTFATHLILTANLYQSTPAAATSGSNNSTALVGIGIPGHTSKLYQLGPLHLLDSVVLLIHRFPRDLRPEEYGRMRNVQDFGEGQPIIQRLRGNPRLLEWAAELLNHLSLEELTQLLCQPVLNLHTSSSGTHLSAPSPTPLVGVESHRMAWIEQQSVWGDLSTEAQTLVRKLVHLLESVTALPPTSQHRGSVLTPQPPQATSPGSELAVTPGAASSTTTLTPNAADAEPAPAQPAPHAITSPSSAPASDDSSRVVAPPKDLMLRTQSEPAPAASPSPAAAHLHTIPPPSLGLHLLPLSDEDDAYDHNAAVLSPVSAPHGDSLNECRKRWAGSNGSSGTITPTSINDAK